MGFLDTLHNAVNTVANKASALGFNKYLLPSLKETTQRAFAGNIPNPQGQFAPEFLNTALGGANLQTHPVLRQGAAAVSSAVRPFASILSQQSNLPVGQNFQEKSLPLQIANKAASALGTATALDIGFKPFQGIANRVVPSLSTVGLQRGLKLATVAPELASNLGLETLTKAGVQSTPLLSKLALTGARGGLSNLMFGALTPAGRTPQGAAANVGIGSLLGSSQVPIAGLADRLQLRNAVSSIVHSGAQLNPTILKQLNPTYDFKAAFRPISELKQQLPAGELDRPTIDYYKQQLLNGQKIEPIVSLKDFGQKTASIIDGDHRLQALKELGIAKAPVFEGQVSPQAGFMGKIKAPIVPQTLTKSKANVIATNLGLKGETPTAPEGSKPLGLVDTIGKSQTSTPELQSLIKGGYDMLPNKVVLEMAQKRIATDPHYAYQYALNNHTAEANTTAILLAKHYELKGQPEIAANLMVQKAKQALQAGQGNQVYSMWNKLSPETVGQTAAKTIEDYNAHARIKIPGLSADQYQSFVDQAKIIQGMSEGRDKELANQKLLEQIGRLIPSSIGNKAIALWRTGLLTGFRTPFKILTSHLASNVMEQLKNIPAAGVDVATSLASGRRSVIASGRGNVAGGWTGTLNAVDNLIHGYNAPNSGGMAKDFINQVNFSNTWYGKIAQTYVDSISRLHGSLYKPFFGAAHLNSLFNQGLAKAKNQGLKGVEAESFVKNFVSNPSPKAAARAIQEAEYTTFQNKTRLSEMASAINRASGGATKIIAPFTQIPSSIAMKLIDYSPVGAVKTIIENIGRGKFDQRDFSQGLGRAITGTGLAAIGGALYTRGMMNLEYPKDKTEQALWKLQGRIADSILVGGKWRQVASLGPTGDALAVGGQFTKGLMDGGWINAGTQGLVGGIQTIASSPYLQGLESISAGLQDPQNKALGITKNYLGSAVPTALANIATTTDPYQRQTNTILDALKNKIPGARETSLPQVNVFGQNVPRAEGGVGLIDPFYSSANISTPLVNELQRLQESNNPVSLTPLAKNQTVYHQKIKLTPDQLTESMKAIGPQNLQALTQIISTPDYQKLDDKEKADLLSRATTQIKQQSDQPISQITGIKPLDSDTTTKAITLYNSISDLPQAQRSQVLDRLEAEDKLDETTYKKYQKMIQARNLGLTTYDQTIKSLNDEARAKIIYQEIRDLSQPERSQKLDELEKKGILTQKVYDKYLELRQKP